MPTMSADLSRTLSGIEQLIESGQLRSSLRAFVEAGNELCGDQTMTKKDYGKLEGKIAGWVRYVKANPKCLTKSFEGQSIIAKTREKIEWQARSSDLFERKDTQAVTVQRQETSSSLIIK